MIINKDNDNDDNNNDNDNQTYLVRVTINSKADKPVPSFRDWIGIWSVCFLWREGNREKPSEHRREPKTNSSYPHVTELNLGDSGGRRALSPLRHSCIPNLLSTDFVLMNYEILGMDNVTKWWQTVRGYYFTIFSLGLKGF